MINRMIINRKLHFIWVGKPMPDKLKNNLKRWEKLHPDWEMKVWGNEDFGWLQNQDLYDRAEEIVPTDAIGQFKSDLARYEIIANHGGFYADCDTYPLKNIEESLGDHTAFAAMEDPRWVGNTYLGGVTDHRVFREIIATIPERIPETGKHRANVLTGPKMLTPIWKRYKLYTAPSRQFFPYLYSHVRGNKVPNKFASDVVCVHEWNHTREVLSARRQKGRNR